MSISKRHTTVLQLVAGSLSRVAESEWQRSCEQVRRISPNVGQLGEWRSLCEGGWTGPAPLDLPSDVVPNDNLLPGERSSDGQGYDKELTVPSRKLLRNSRGNSPTSEGWQGSSSRTSFERPRQQGLAPEFNPLPEGRNNSATSLTSLGSFPVPPAHFPLPPVQTSPREKEDVTTQRERKTDAVTLPPEQPPSTRTARELRISTLPNTMLPDGPATTPLETPSPLGPTEGKGNFTQQEKKGDDRNLVESQVNNPTPKEPVASSAGMPMKPNDQSPQTPQRIEATNAELGFKQGSDSTPHSSSHGKGIERSDTGSKSNGSIVAALRDRYTRAVSFRLISKWNVVVNPLLPTICRLDRPHPLRKMFPAYLSACPTLQLAMSLPLLQDKQTGPPLKNEEDFLQLIERSLPRPLVHSQHLQQTIVAGTAIVWKTSENSNFGNTNTDYVCESMKLRNKP